MLHSSSGIHNTGERPPEFLITASVGADRFSHGNTNRKQETAPLASPTTSVIPSEPALTSRDSMLLSSSRVARHDPLFRSHTFTVPFSEPETTRPSPVNVNAQTPPPCPDSVRSS